MTKPIADQHAENELIGCLLLHPGQIAEIQQIIAPADFFFAPEREVYEALLRTQGEYQPQDYVFLRREIKERGHPDRVPETFFLDVVTNLGNAMRAADHAKSILRNSRVRSIHRLSLDVTQAFNAGKLYSEREISEIHHKILRLTMDATGLQDVRTMRELMRDFDLRSVATNRRVGEPAFGLVDLDDHCDFFEKSTFSIIAGRPRMGKTSLMRHAIRRIADRHQVLCFTLEETAEMIRDKLLCTEAGVSYRKYAEGRIGKDEVDRMVLAADAINGLKVDFYRGTMDAAKVGAIARRRAANGAPPRVIFIDHLQQLEHPRQKGDTEAYAIGKTTRQLCALAKELECSIVLLAQLNRGPEYRQGGRPILADLRDSGSIEQDAWNILFLWSPDPTQNERNLYLAKHRNGPTIECDVVFLMERGFFADYNWRHKHGSHGQDWALD